MTQVQKYGHEHTRFSEIHLTRMVSETSPLHQPGGQTNQESDNPINKKLTKHLQKIKMFMKADLELWLFISQATISMLEISIKTFLQDSMYFNPTSTVI